MCRAERGVIHIDDGSFWTGSWVVAKEHAERSERLNAYVALHEKQSEQFHLQGTITNWRPAARERLYADKEVQTNEGVKFLVAPTSTPLPWRGNGTIEKRYWYGTDEV